ncbi:helix-turn-helix domain-containing protein [Providencia vermicola]|uniref:helix-turn-helix domain-containing protein n=1 Tax=Providencia vermicola TaxID=333965 RepID=UPI002AB50024|nr:AraC family transcriptional regulator [Providencia stuartii]
MLCRRYQPHPDLQPWLAHCWEWGFNKNHILPEIFPGTGAEILFNLGDDFSITSVSQYGLPQNFLVNQGAAILLSPRYRRLIFSPCNKGHILSLRLRSAAWFEIFNIPLDHICDQVLHLDELGISPPKIELMHKQGAPILGHWIRQELTRQSRRELNLLHPIEKLYRGLPYSEFRQLLDINPRTLQRRLRCYLGVDARYFQRTARFQRTLRRLLSGTPLFDTMLDEGYYDQSHFIKDCQFFTQRSPTNLLAQEQIILNYYNHKIDTLVSFF